MPELVYKRAGHIELIRYRDSKRFLFNGVVQSLVPSITNNVSELEDGNSDWNYVFSAGKAGTLTVNLNSFQPRLYAALITATFEDETDLNIRRIQEITVPSESPYTVELLKTPEEDNINLVNEDDSPFVKTGTSPAAGEFSVSADTLEFNSADAETYLVVAYDYKSTNAKQSQLPESVNDDNFRLTIAGEAVLKHDEGTRKVDSMTFDKVRAEGEVAMPSRQREPQTWTFNMRVLRPRPGQKVVDYRVEE